MMTDVVPELITEDQWQMAHTIARELVEAGADVNELGKAIAYLRSAINRDSINAGTQFFKFLRTLVSHGKEIGHSGRTIDYYRNLDKVCNIYLRSKETDCQGMLQSLCWAARLMRYYKVTPIGETLSFTSSSLSGSIESPRKAEIIKLNQSQVFKIKQIIEAIITKVSGNKITYEIMGAIRFTEKEPKKAASFREGQLVKVQIIDLKEDGSIRKIKCVSGSE